MDAQHDTIYAESMAAAPGDPEEAAACVDAGTATTKQDICERLIGEAYQVIAALADFAHLRFRGNRLLLEGVRQGAHEEDLIANLPALLGRQLLLSLTLGHRVAASLTRDCVQASYRFVEMEGAGHFLVDLFPDQTSALLLEHINSH